MEEAEAEVDYLLNIHVQQASSLISCGQKRKKKDEEERGRRRRRRRQSPTSGSPVSLHTSRSLSRGVAA